MLQKPYRWNLGNLSWIAERLQNRKQWYYCAIKLMPVVIIQQCVTRPGNRIRGKYDILILQSRNSWYILS